MSRQVMAPAKAAVECTGLSGVTYRAKDGRYTMSDSDAKALVKAGGFLPSLSGTRAHGTGRTCLECGFGSWFVKCSRCGGECVRESERDVPPTPEEPAR